MMCSKISKSHKIKNFKYLKYYLQETAEEIKRRAMSKITEKTRPNSRNLSVHDYNYSREREEEYNEALMMAAN